MSVNAIEHTYRTPREAEFLDKCAIAVAPAVTRVVMGFMARDEDLIIGVEHADTIADCAYAIAQAMLVRSNDERR